MVFAFSKTVSLDFSSFLVWHSNQAVFLVFVGVRFPGLSHVMMSVDASL